MRQDFAPGDRLGRYELVATIGGGGFASVWRARTEGIGGFEREFAVKVLRQGRASRKRFQDMLLDEARLVARIEHPNVAQIFEVGEDPRSLYFVMELVDGDSLDELAVRADAAGQTLPVRALFRVLADASAGLHAAHELSQDGQLLGLVHRDVSPQNILVSRAGIAKLIDFGIAKAKERLAPDTTTGYIKGKISFMAPEQARAEEIDRRADLWAMGAVAYEVLEGRPPFDAGTDLGRLAALVGPTPVPPLSDRAPLPLRRVVECCLQKDVEARYATALELKEAIEEALIESELETSVEEAAALLEPFFHTRRVPSVPSGPAATSPPTPRSLGQAAPALVPDPALAATVRARSIPPAGATGSETEHSAQSAPRSVQSAEDGDGADALAATQPRDGAGAREAGARDGADGGAREAGAREADTSERAVSSTIELRPKTETIEIPRRKSSWPWLGVAAGVVGLGVWLAARPDADEPRAPEAAPSGAASSQPAPSQDARSDPDPAPVRPPSASGAVLAPPLQSFVSTAASTAAGTGSSSPGLLRSGSPSPATSQPNVAPPAGATRPPDRPFRPSPTANPTPPSVAPTVDPDAIE